MNPAVPSNHELDSRRRDRLESIGLMAGCVAHDLGNLLTPLVAYPDLIRRDLPAGSRGTELLAIMDDTIADVVRINQQMAMMSMRAGTEDKTYCPVDAIKRVAALIAESVVPDGVQIQTELAGDIGSLKGNPEQMVRVIYNLCQNALDAIEDAGHLRITARGVSLQSAPAGVDHVEPGEYAHISVSDTGCGIDPDIAHRIYEPFFTTKTTGPRRGSGLGLSIVRDIVRDYDGYLSFDSTPDKGTTFDIYLPLTSTPPPGGDRARATQSSMREETRAEPKAVEPGVIIVDDEENIRRIFGMVLASAFPRATIDTASNGEEAIHACRDRAYDVIIMDLRMPIMDGREAFCEIEALSSERSQKMPAFVFCTGFAPPDVIKQIVQDGSRHCLLSKPVRSEVLIKQVASRLA